MLDTDLKEQFDGIAVRFSTWKSHILIFWNSIFIPDCLRLSEWQRFIWKTLSSYVGKAFIIPKEWIQRFWRIHDFEIKSKYNPSSVKRTL